MDSSKRRFGAFREQLRRGALSAGPAEGVVPAGAGSWSQRRAYLRQYVGWLRPFRWGIAAVFGLALITSLLGLILPRATMYIIDVVLPGGERRMLHLLGLGLLAVLIVQQSLELRRNWRVGVLNARVVFRLRQRLYEHLLRLPLHELAEMKTGGITSRLSGDVDSVSGLVQIAIITPGVALTKVMLTVVVLLWISWQMALAAVLLLPPIVILNLFYIRRIRPIYRSQRRDRAAIDGRVVETFGGIRVVRAFGREATEGRRYALAHHTVIRKKLLARLLEYIVWSAWGVVIPLAGLIIVWYGSTLVLAGKTTVGGIIAFQLYLMMLLMPVSAIVKSYGEMQQALAAMERVFDLLRRPLDKPDPPGALEAPARVESFEFDRVSFAYRQPAAERPASPAPAGRAGRVLHCFSLRVPGGATVALVGPSGAGKTTVTNLVARFYDPQHGALRLNGIDLRRIKLRSYRRLIGLVQQDVFLFDGTIAENIAYGRRGASRPEIEEAARRANAHEFITAFAAGYDTLVGERGVRLSGGQAQRISIARALLADPQILILDEATSNLDSQSEELIQASMRALMADRTTFVIAHRLSTVVNADLIVVMERGRIVESGSHEQLMAAAGRYRAMVERQQRGLVFEAAPQPAEWLA